MGRHSKSQILLGLRGTGKTVLLNQIERMAEEGSHLAAYIEAPEEKPLPALLYPKIHQAIRGFSLVARAREKSHAAFRALRAFAAAFKVTVGDLSISVDLAVGARFDRLTPKEREYVFAMASLGKGPYRSADVAATLDDTKSL